MVLEQMLDSSAGSKGQQSPEQDAVARVELAEMFLNEFCDARLAQEIIAPVLNHPVYAEKARLSSLMAKLYDRQESAYDLSLALKDYAKDYVQQDFVKWSQKSWGLSERTRLAKAGIDPLDAFVFAATAKNASGAKQVGATKKSKASSLKSISSLGGSIREVPSMQALLEAHLQVLPKNRRRLRIGVLSSMLHASPVYYLCFQFLKVFAKKHDLVLFGRGTKRDWATSAFEEIAAEVRDVASLDHRQLAQEMQDSELDILFEMSGWMDVDGLKAVSTKPAPYQYKWVGGQAATTGLDCFDGYLCSPHQLPDVSPTQMAKLYSEPLLMIQEGATLYIPPAYMPKAQVASGTYAAVIGNPSKLAHDWALLLKTNRLSLPAELILIDHSYTKAYVRQTVAKRFAGLSVTLKFVAPKSHEDFLKQINQVHTVWDLGPYTAGLTACEVLHLKKNLLTVDTGLLYCERHSWAHRESVVHGSATNGGLRRSTQSIQPSQSTQSTNARQARQHQVKKSSKNDVNV
jgi:predicted O-linked N-acetylglucosamine transferase (SPINDLY family)